MTSASPSFLRTCFFSVLAAVFILTLYLLSVSGSLFYGSYYPFPSLSEIKHNLTLFFNGSPNGYSRCLWGYIAFGLMASFFLSFGKLILNAIIRGGSSKLNRLEFFALSYILGSLFASLLWFGLGMTGLIKTWLAFGLAMAGGAGIIISAASCREFLKGCLRSAASLTLLEKSLALIIFAILMLFSATAVIEPTYSDTWITHLALPNFYINAGRLAFNPHHFHSYLPENTEMLVMWALLLKSEFAASLINWGFLIALVALVSGHLTRVTDKFSALLAAIALLSAYAVAHATMMIKNDLPLYLCVYAHFYALAHNENEETAQTPWFFLSGVFCGGAIGHKLTGLAVACVSLGLILMTDVILHRKRRMTQMPIFLFSAGLGLAYFPWMIRTWIGSGNPIFPFFNPLFHSKGNPLDAAVNTVYFDTHRLRDIVDYFDALLTSGGRPWYSPALLFGLLMPFAWTRKNHPGLKMALLSAVLSILILLVSKNIRYTIGNFIFIVSVSLGLALHALGPQNLNPWKKTVIAAVLLFSLFQTYWNTERWLFFRSSVNMILSGYTPGNFRSYTGESDEAADMRWMAYLIESRTPKNEGVLYAGTCYAYGLRRKADFRAPENKDRLHEIAQASENPRKMKVALEALGIRHILLRSDFFQQFEKFPMNQWPVSAEDIKRIRSFLETEAQFRHASPDKLILWYTLNASETFPALTFNQEDAVQFPVKLIEEAYAWYGAGQLEVSRQMGLLALSVPMRPKRSLEIYDLLIAVAEQEKNLDKNRENFLTSLNQMESKITSAGERKLIGTLYLKLGDPQKAADFLIN